MGESLFTYLCMENNRHPSTFLSMDPVGAPLGLGGADEFDRELLIQQRPQNVWSGAPDINIPFPGSPLNLSWNLDSCDMLDVGLAPHVYDSDVDLGLPKLCANVSMGVNGINGVNASAGARKCVKRGDSVWGAWFFFNFYFKPVLQEKAKGRITRDANGTMCFDKSDLQLDVFLVQHDMENMYMWVFKERPENALGKMQLRSFMNGHSRPGEPLFPFCVEKGFIRSHRMQRKQYRGLSNPQCLHGIEIVRSPNLSAALEADHKKWIELTGRELNFSIPLEASDFGSWRSLPSSEFELEKPAPPLKSNSNLNSRKLLNGSSLDLSTQPSNAGADCMDLTHMSTKRPHMMDEDVCLNTNAYFNRPNDMEIQLAGPSWLNEFTGVMRHACGPASAAKTIYEDEEGFLIVVSLPFSDPERVKVTWKNSLTHGIVKISCVSTARMPFIKRDERTFKLTDPSPEHCPPGEFFREIPLPARIPEDANLEAYYYDTSKTVLEILVPKHRLGPEEHEVPVCMRPPTVGANAHYI